MKQKLEQKTNPKEKNATKRKKNAEKEGKKIKKLRKKRDAQNRLQQRRKRPSTPEGLAPAEIRGNA